jgi:hypothetical protein
MMASVRAREADRAGQAMPRGVRNTLFAVVGVVLAGALYLIAVRGEALLADLSGLGQRIIACF